MYTCLLIRIQERDRRPPPCEIQRIYRTHLNISLETRQDRFPEQFLHDRYYCAITSIVFTYKRLIPPPICKYDRDIAGNGIIVQCNVHEDLCKAALDRCCDWKKKRENYGVFISVELFAKNSKVFERVDDNHVTFSHKWSKNKTWNVYENSVWYRFRTEYWSKIQSIMFAALAPVLSTVELEQILYGCLPEKTRGNEIRGIEYQKRIDMQNSHSL